MRYFGVTAALIAMVATGCGRANPQSEAGQSGGFLLGRSSSGIVKVSLNDGSVKVLYSNGEDSWWSLGQAVYDHKRNRYYVADAKASAIMRFDPLTGERVPMYKGSGPKTSFSVMGLEIMPECSAVFFVYDWALYRHDIEKDETELLIPRTEDPIYRCVADGAGASLYLERKSGVYVLDLKTMQINRVVEGIATL